MTDRQVIFLGSCVLLQGANLDRDTQSVVTAARKLWLATGQPEGELWIGTRGEMATTEGE